MKKGIILTIMIGMLLTCNIGCSSEKKPAVVPTKEVKPTIVPTKEENRSSELSKLKERVPEYFVLNTTKGLKVYVWQMAPNSYSFGLVSGTNKVAENEGLLVLRGVSLEEMKLILSTYNVPREQITIKSYYNPISSYAGIFDDSYIDKLYHEFGLRD